MVYTDDLVYKFLGRQFPYLQHPRVRLLYICIYYNSLEAIFQSFSVPVYVLYLILNRRNVIKIYDRAMRVCFAHILFTTSIAQYLYNMVQVKCT